MQDGPFAARKKHSPVVDTESAATESAWTRDPNRKTSRPIARIHLLGAMRATSYLGDDILPRGRKARAILGCLCLASGQRLARNRLATMLWDAGLIVPMRTFAPSATSAGVWLTFGKAGLMVPMRTRPLSRTSTGESFT